MTKKTTIGLPGPHARDREGVDDAILDSQPHQPNVTV